MTVLCLSVERLGMPAGISAHLSFIFQYHILIKVHTSVTLLRGDGEGWHFALCGY